MEWVLTETAETHSLKESPSSYPDMDLTQAAYMDDVILWDGKTTKLQFKVEQLRGHLQQWGLPINSEKCVLYVSPKHEGPNFLKLQDFAMKAEPCITIKGMPFKVGSNAEELLTPVWERAKSKFWAMKHVFLARTSITERLRVFNTTFWCVAGIHPERNALEAVNSLMYHLISYMLRVPRQSQEG